MTLKLSLYWCLIQHQVTELLLSNIQLLVTKVH